jgi:hypothetical protein
VRVRGRRARRRPDRRYGAGAIALAWLAPFVAAAAFSTAAQAQLSLSASVTSDYRYRGASLGSDQPALSVSAAYDAPMVGGLDGYFAGAATVGRFPGAGLQLFANTEAIGVAGAAWPSASWDVGLSNTVLSYDFGPITRVYDPELYTGVRIHFISVYVRYSPHYFREGVGALYAEIDGSVPLDSRWRLLAHAGVLTPIAMGAANASMNEEYDGSLGVSTLFRRVQLSAAWTFQRPGYEAFLRPAPHADALSLTATWFF